MIAHFEATGKSIKVHDTSTYGSPVAALLDPSVRFVPSETQFDACDYPAMISDTLRFCLRWKTEPAWIRTKDQGIMRRPDHPSAVGYQ